MEGWRDGEERGKRREGEVVCYSHSVYKVGTSFTLYKEFLSS